APPPRPSPSGARCGPKTLRMFVVYPPVPSRTRFSKSPFGDERRCAPVGRRGPPHGPTTHAATPPERDRPAATGGDAAAGSRAGVPVDGRARRAARVGRVRALAVAGGVRRDRGTLDGER